MYIYFFSYPLYYIKIEYSIKYIQWVGKALANYLTIPERLK